MPNVTLINADGVQWITDNREKNQIIVTDPPFNIGYHYNGYKDKMPEDDYLNMLEAVFSGSPFVIIHYPEEIYKLALKLQATPRRVISWVYNSNTAKQHRDIAYFGVDPNLNQVRQPYKNPNDKRIKARIKAGALGGRLYDWWNVNQVKNVSKKEINHPCIMPLEVMKNAVGILPKGTTIVDPFMGTGTTGLACIEMGYDFVGIEINEDYYKMAKKRVAELKENVQLEGN